jgi:FHS family L-fucose permease-like MFS transporter
VQPAASVIKPYVGLGIALVVLALLIGAAKLPEIQSAEHHIGEKVNDSIWKHPNLIFGAIAIFVYVGAEVSIGSSIANYLALDNIGHFISKAAVPDAATRYQQALVLAARYISLYWLGAMVGRFAGSALLTRFRATALLGLAAAIAAGLCLAVSQVSGAPAAGCAIAVGLVNSIMFPTIFTITLERTAASAASTSGLLCMAIIGGAILPRLSGRIADDSGLHMAFLVPTVAYAAISLFALGAAKARTAVAGRVAASQAVH